MAPKPQTETATTEQALAPTAAAQKNDEPKLYAITFRPAGKRGNAPEELHVGLPGGSTVYMNANHPAQVPDTSVKPTDENPKPMRDSKLGDPGYPYAEALLTDEAAKEWAAHYALHGLELKPIAASAFKRHPLHENAE